LYAVSAIDVDTAWAVGRRGTILHTSDGGRTWSCQASGVECTLVAVSAVDRYTAWATGAGVVLKTVDGGATWTCRYENEGGNAISAVNTNIAWVVGSHGEILKTTDGGENWISQESGTRESLRGISAVDADNAWAVGDKGILLHTGNRGVDWLQERCTLPGLITVLNDVYAVNKNTAWAVGSGVIRTTNGGAIWTAQNLRGLFFGVCALSSNTAWVIGEKTAIHKTVDGGKTWIKRESWKGDLCEPRGYYHGISAADEDNAWVVGGWMGIAKTVDGGLNWIPQGNGLDKERNSTIPTYHIMQKVHLFSKGHLSCR